MNKRDGIEMVCSYILCRRATIHMQDSKAWLPSNIAEKDNTLSAEGTARPKEKNVSHLMDVFDIDTGSSCIIFEDDLLQEHKRALVLCMLPYLQCHEPFKY